MQKIKVCCEVLKNLIDNNLLLPKRYQPDASNIEKSLLGAELQFVGFPRLYQCPGCKKPIEVEEEDKLNTIAEKLWWNIARLDIKAFQEELKQLFIDEGWTADDLAEKVVNYKMNINSFTDFFVSLGFPGKDKGK